MSIDSRNNQMAIHFQYSSLPEMHVKLEFKNKMYNQNIKQRAGERAKTGWLGIRIVCPTGATYLTANCCFSELAL
jgi:hypothetical protein